MATGQLPFRGETSGVIFEAIMNRAPVSPLRLNPELPEKFEALLQKALDKDRNLRYQSAADLRTDLMRLKRELESGSNPSSFTGTPAAEERKSGAVPLAVSGAVPSAASPSGSGPACSSAAVSALSASGGGAAISFASVTAAAAITPSSAAVAATADSSRKWVPWAAGIAALALIGGAIFLFTARHARALTDKDTVVLSEFVNTTGDTVFDGTLKQALAVQLDQSPYLNLLPESKVQEALKYMGRKPDIRITRDLAKEISMRENAKAIIAGSISGLGSHYVITVEAINVQSGDSLAREQAEAASKEEVLKAVDKAASGVRQKLGESLASIQQFATPLAEASTSSLDALKEFSIGLDLHNRSQDSEALEHFKRATDLDANFAMGWATQGIVNSNLGSRKLADEQIQKAYDLRERASERERLYITGHYYGKVAGDIEKEAELYEHWLQIYPRDNRPLANLSLASQELGDYDKGLKVATQDLAVWPGDSYGFQNQMSIYISLNRWDEARAVGESAKAQNVDTVAIRSFFMLLAATKHDEAEMQRVLASAAGKPWQVNLFSRLWSYQDTMGEIKASHATQEQALVLASKLGFTEARANQVSVRAMRDAFHGLSAVSKQEAAETLHLTDERTARALVAIALAQCGDTAQAEKLTADLGRSYPDDTVLKYSVVPAVQALVLLQRREPAKAVAALEPARKYELAFPLGSNNTAYVVLYLRGLAYLDAKDGAKAAGEFQKILDHNGVNPTSVFLPLAQLGLARAYVLQTDAAKAKTAYQDFFATWKDADSDIPVLIAARAEYAKLK